MITFSEAGKVATIMIDNPPLNLLNTQMRREILRITAELKTDDKISVVVIEGAGDLAFSAGSDVREFPEDPIDGMAKIRFEQFVLEEIQRLPQITICKLQGYTFGGGAVILLACDLRVAAKDAKIAFPEIKLAAFPAGGGTHLLVRELGPARAKELVLFGDTISAARAEAIGLINRVVPESELGATVDDLAARLASTPREALVAAKRSLNCGVWADFEAGQTSEVVGYASLYEKSNLLEGVRAFIEKRKPVFKD